MRKLTVLVTIIALFIGCSTQHGVEAETQQHLETQVPRPGYAQQDNLDICEAVFRYLFKHNASKVQQKAKSYFITIFKQDPSDEFLARFTGNNPPVRKGSDFAIGEGLVFSIGSIIRIGEDTAQVCGGYYETGLSSSGNIYTVVRKNGLWVVENDEMLWIS